MLTYLRQWLSSLTKPSPKSDYNKMIAAIGIDVSGPEFFDLYPTKNAISERIRASAMFHGDAIEWMSITAHKHITRSATNRHVMEQIVRSGEPLDEAAVSALGFYRKMKIGHRYAAAIACNDARAATDRLKFDLLVACSKANQLHNIRRHAECGTRLWTFKSALDERCTPLERELEGKVFTEDEARALVLSRPEEIWRSYFRAHVEF